jgi:hypothetical protein
MVTPEDSASCAEDHALIFKQRVGAVLPITGLHKHPRRPLRRKGEKLNPIVSYCVEDNLTRASSRQQETSSVDTVRREEHMQRALLSHAM